MAEALDSTLSQEAERQGIALVGENYDQKFCELFEELAATKGKTIMLTDEYDQKSTTKYSGVSHTV